LTRRFEAAVPGLSLSGVPALLKDLFDVGGEPTNAGSIFLAEVRPPRPVGHDGAVGSRLAAGRRRNRGQTQMAEFAYGLTGENAHYGDCVHPAFPIALRGDPAADQPPQWRPAWCPSRPASDTGGSIAFPRRFAASTGCGWRLTRSGSRMQCLWRSLSTLTGWFTGTAEDMRLSLDGLLPFIERAKGARAVPSEEPVPARGCYLEMPHVDREVARACAAAAERLACLPGHVVKHTLHQAFAHAPLAYQVIGSLAAWEAHQPWFASHRDRYSRWCATGWSARCIGNPGRSGRRGRRATGSCGPGTNIFRSSTIC